MSGCVKDSRTVLAVSITDLGDGGKTVSITDLVETPCLELFNQDYMQPWVWSDDIEWVTYDKGLLYMVIL